MTTILIAILVWCLIGAIICNIQQYEKWKVLTVADVLMSLAFGWFVGIVFVADFIANRGFWSKIFFYEIIKK